MGMILNIVFSIISLPVMVIMLPFRIVKLIIFFILRNVFNVEVVTHDIPSLKYVTHKRNPRRGVLLEIEGRHKNFIIDYVVNNVLKLNNRSYIRVTQREVRVIQRGIFNSSHHVLPLTAVTTSHYQYKKKVRWLIYGVVMLVWTLLNLLSLLSVNANADSFFRSRSSSFDISELLLALGLVIYQYAVFILFIDIVLIVILIAGYYLSRDFFIGFSTQNIEDIAGLSFAPSLPLGLGKNIPYDELKNIFEHINRSILKSHHL